MRSAARRPRTRSSCTAPRGRRRDARAGVRRRTSLSPIAWEPPEGRIRYRKRMRSLPIVLIALLTGCLTAHRPPSTGHSEREDLPDRAAEFFAMKRGITATTDTHALYAAARARIAEM